jgi:hypothetical protein
MASTIAPSARAGTTDNVVQDIDVNEKEKGATQHVGRESGTSNGSGKSGGT